MIERAREVGTQVLRERWPQAQLLEVQQLDGSDRNCVIRATATSCPCSSVIVKLHLTADRSAAVREAAALSVLRGQPGAVQLLGVSTDPPGVVVEDLGTVSSLADDLLGSDPVRARASVLAWAAAMADLSQLVPAASFEDQLRRHADRLGQPAPAVDAMPEALTKAAASLAETAPRLGVTPSAEALGELRDLALLLGGGPEAIGLTPSDACPDNNAQLPEGLVLLDFEGAQARHLAWDMAYLTVPWPSCWCSWRMPEAVATEALSLWRERVPAAYVRSRDFDRDLTAASVGWALVSTSWFLAAALESGLSSSDAMPSRRAMIQHRLAAVDDPRLPALTVLARDLLAASIDAWGPLELAPAFR